MIKTSKLQLNQPDATAVHPDRNHLQNNCRCAGRRSVGCRERSTPLGWMPDQMRSMFSV